MNVSQEIIPVGGADSADLRLPREPSARQGGWSPTIPAGADAAEQICLFPK